MSLLRCFEQIEKSAHKSVSNTNDSVELEKAQKEIRVIDAKTERISDLPGETSAPAALLRKIESLEQERADIQRTVEPKNRSWLIISPSTRPQSGLLMKQLAIPLSNHKTVAKWLVIRANGLFTKRVSTSKTVRA